MNIPEVVVKLKALKPENRRVNTMKIITKSFMSNIKINGNDVEMFNPECYTLRTNSSLNI